MNRYKLSAYAISVSNFLKNNASAGDERFPITVNEWGLQHNWTSWQKNCVSLIKTKI